MLTGGLLGLLIGIVLGLTGAGGGIFAVPALVFGLDMDIRAAAPIALLAVGTAAAYGAIQGLRHKIVRYKAASVLAIGGSLTAPLGVTLAQWLSPQVLNYTFVAIMLVVAYRMFLSSRPKADATSSTVGAEICKISEKTGRFIWSFKTVVTMAGIGMVAGIFTGMLGVGGGFIIVPALAYFSDLRMHQIVATSLLVIALLAAITISFTLGQSFTLTPAAGAFWAVALAGMVLARRVAPQIPAAMLQRVFAAACVAVALMMLMR